MSSEVTQSVENAERTVKKPKRLGWLVWTLIFGLVLLNVGVITNVIELNQRTLAWGVFRIDPRYWPIWPVAVLWGIVAWLACDVFRRFDFIRKKLFRIRIGIVIVTLCWTAWFCGWTMLLLRRKIYQQIYVAYIMGPISMYMADGTWSWKLLIAPTLAVVTIVSLLYVAYRQRRQKT